MVKNKKGGSSHKKMARKNVRASFVKRKMRKSENELEIYAKVTAMHGGGHAEVLCSDNKRRLLVIRGKFKGRNKRDNSIKLNSIVLAGIRDFEVVQANKKEKVDLIYVYNDGDLNELKKIQEVKVILGIADNAEEDDMPFELTHKEDTNDEPVITLTENKKINKTEEFNIDGLDFDDI